MAHIRAETRALVPPMSLSLLPNRNTISALESPVGLRERSRALPPLRLKPWPARRGQGRFPNGQVR